MDKILEKMKEGYKFCTETISPDCLVLAKGDRFVANRCIVCQKLKTRLYYQKYHKEHPPKKKQPKINQETKVLGKKDKDAILKFLEKLGEEDFNIE